MLNDNLQTTPRHKILELLKRNGALTLDELVDLLSLSKTATCAHLLKLEEGEFVRRVPAPTKTTGRPPSTFAITSRGARVFPSDDAALLTELLELTLERDESIVRDYFVDLWARRREEFESSLSDETRDDTGYRRLRLETLLERTNFMPEISRSPSGNAAIFTVRECNCPFPAAVRATSIPCELEREFLETALRGKCVGSYTARDRSEVCTFRIRVPPP